MRRRREKNPRTALTSSTLCTSDIPLIPPRMVVFTADAELKQEPHQVSYVSIFKDSEYYVVPRVPECS
jgi:hypothetical protein